MVHHGTQTRRFVVMLKTDRIPMHERHSARKKTMANYRAVAHEFLEDVNSMIKEGYLPGIVCAGVPNLAALPVVFVEATDIGIDELRNDPRVAAITAD